MAAALAADPDGLARRFWAKVGGIGRPGCWLWTASTTKGYGQFTIRHAGTQHHLYAHRVAYVLTHGAIPATLKIMHVVCDTPRCCRPDHLRPGTQAENMADARQKGRLVEGRHLVKVPESGVVDIRANYQPRRNGKQLAAKYGISLIHVLRIARGTSRRLARPVFERVQHVELPVVGEVS